MQVAKIPSSTLQTYFVGIVQGGVLNAAVEIQCYFWKTDSYVLRFKE